MDRGAFSNWPQILWYFETVRALSSEDWSELAMKRDSVAAEQTGDELGQAKEEVAAKLGSVDAMDRIGVAIVREIALVEPELEERILAGTDEAVPSFLAYYQKTIPQYDLDEARLRPMIAGSLRTLFKSGAVALALKPHIAAKSFKALWAPWERRLPKRSIPK
jgi:hypothetical protein